MSNNYIERKCSASLVMRQMQIKTTMSYNLMPVRIVLIKKTKDKMWWWGCRENSVLHTLLVGLEISTGIIENSMGMSQKIKDRTTTWFSSPHYRKDMQRKWNWSVCCSTIDDSQDTESTEVSINWWMDKQNVVHVSTGIVFNHKKNKFCRFLQQG